MSSEFAAALVTLVGTLSVVVVTAIVTFRRIRRELASQYDIALRSDRLDAYRLLWSQLQPLAKYARPAPVTGATATALLERLRRWYFETGGIFLSNRSRNAYFRLLDELMRAGVRHGADDELPLEVFERLRILGSRLRSALVQDIQTRRGSALAGE